MTTPSIAVGMILALSAARGLAGEALPRRSLEQRLYVAAVNAAEARLRLHDVASARHFLEEAPQRLRGFEWRWLSAQADRSAVSANIASDAITHLETSPDGMRLAVAVLDSTIAILDAPAAPGTTGHGASQRGMIR